MPQLVELDIDDFVAQFNHIVSSDKPTFVSDFISVVKSKNPDLKFGVTLYETELTGAGNITTMLPQSVRDRIDVVHFYVAYRQDGPNIVSYLPQIHDEFPNAQIMGGQYAYDRINYANCKPGSKAAPCTAVQEIQLFENLFDAELSDVRSGVLGGLEFYPGYFGAEATMPTWKSARGCAAGQTAACIANTQTMRAYVRKALSAP